MTKELLADNAQNFIRTASMIIALIIFVFVVWVAVQIHGQDIDPNAYCLYADQQPFKELCNEQKINDIVADVLNESKRFDCYNNPASDCP